MTKKLLIVGLVCGLLISWAALAQAEEGGLHLYAGLGYNTYNFDYHNQLVDQKNGINEIDGGTNHFAGLRGWLNDNWALGLEMEQFTVEADRLYVDSEQQGDIVEYKYYKNFSATTIGRLLTFACQLSDSRETDVLFIMGAGNYKTDLSYQGRVEEESETVGVKTGLKTNHQLSSNLMLSGRVMYRAADFDPDLEADWQHNIIDFTGLELSGGLTFRF